MFRRSEIAVVPPIGAGVRDFRQDVPVGTLTEKILADAQVLLVCVLRG